jgi:hypothetical protein
LLSGIKKNDFLQVLPGAGIAFANLTMILAHVIQKFDFYPERERRVMLFSFVSLRSRGNFDLKILTIN